MPIRYVARSAADTGEDCLTASCTVGLAAPARPWMIQHIPLDDVHVPFCQFMTDAIAIGVVQTDTGRPAYASAVPPGSEHHLPHARVRHAGESVAIIFGQRGGIVS